MKILLLSFLVIISAVSFGSVYATTYDVSMPKDSSERGCEIIATCYLPNSLSISIGDTVVWKNDDDSPHTVTSGSPETGGPDEIFDSSLMKAGETFSHKFTQAGTFPYFCLIHPWMEGSIKVEKATSSFEQTSTTQPSSDNGGCLIATATFGSELAPQVQQLRELRDNTLLQSSSGSVFMTGFNQLYYSFSPTIADWERQNPAFKEAVSLQSLR